MTTVNPPSFVKIPAKLLNDPELRDYFESRDFIQYQLYLRTGGSDDGVEDIENGELYEPGIQTSNADELIEELEVDMAGMVHLLAERIEDLESSASPSLEIEEPEDVYPSIPQEIEIVAITSDFTTTGSQIIICNNTVANTVTLNPNPDDGEQVHIKRMDAPVSVVGQVDGITPNDILYQYDSPHLVYTTDAGQWGLI